MANTGPPPAKLCALNDLWEREVGEKVRILGCITNYNTKTAILTLHPPHSPSNPSSSSNPSPSTTPTAAAHIDLTLLLSTSPPPLTTIGEWVNVIGYITSQTPPSPSSAAPPPPPLPTSRPLARGSEARAVRGRGGGRREAGTGRKEESEHVTSIQALLLWSAGSLDIQAYDSVLRDLKAEAPL
ncbi:hypothetical protein V494_02090 [Pseudogymnoascus sp. VKM F-4513 (FW-928)]|nr:hypothetical protein V494_02090 [Pseudogymnoascus sp. VKM F-4513 (FW-928)]